MFQAIRKHLTPSTFIAFIALIFAITGGAFAASGNGGGTGSRATASVTRGNPVAAVAKSKAKPKTKAGPRGPAGPAGKNGTNGATGSAGPVGAPGAGGPQGPAGGIGPQGPAGTAGTNGTNGENGKNGKNGTFGGESLPSGKTLTGAWAGTGYAGEATAVTSVVETGVSFALPLASKPTVLYIGLEEGAGEAHPAPAITKGECTGNHNEPGAHAGYLCVFGHEEENVVGQPEVRLQSVPASGSTFGFTLVDYNKAKGVMVIEGTWAVTAE